ncbi:MAG TPA: TetR family transcriptional regulator [Mycobacteriales bacterium]|nr:TetR family transcriptional regulator [Mycobacteriales bacterium]
MTDQSTARPADDQVDDDTVAPQETSAQRARRTRILEATLELARSGGYEAVQMRAVAEMSEVALGTLYRYFPSKVHLLVSAMASQLEQMRTSLQRRTIPGDSRLERVAYVLERSTRSLQRNPNLTEAMVRAMMAADASVAAEVTAVRAQMGELIIKALRNGSGAQPDDEALAGILQDVWFARQIAWLGGRIGTDEVWREIEQAIELVLRR